MKPLNQTIQMAADGTTHEGGAVPIKKGRSPVDRDNFSLVQSPFQSTKMCIFHKANTTGSKSASAQSRIYFLPLGVSMEKKKIACLSFIKTEFHSFIYLHKCLLNTFYIASAE